MLKIFTRNLKLSHLVQLVCLMFATICGLGQVSGIVFRDYNFDGMRTTVSGPNSTVEPLVPGIVVNAYNNTNQIIASYKTTTGIGTYPFSGNNLNIPATGTVYNGTVGSNTGALPAGTRVRLEFVLPALSSSGSSESSSHSGTFNGTAEQFVTAGPSATANYALNNIIEYNTGTDGVFMHHPILMKGDPLPPGSAAGANTVFVGFPYSNAGSTTPPTYTLKGSTIGSCWGVAYSRQCGKIFTSAFIKRQVGLGPMGSGGLYLLEPSGTSYNVTRFFNLDTNTFNTAASPVTRTRASTGAPAYGSGLSYNITIPNMSVAYLGAIDAQSGFPVGLGVVGTNTQRGLTTTPDGYYYDPATFDQIGKVGIGDIEISEDGKYLFVMNLYSRKVIRLTLNDAFNPTVVTAAAAFNIPSAVADSGVIRPFGLKFYRGDLYIGAVASGENAVSKINTILRAYVFKLNDACTDAAAYTTGPIINIPLSYRKGSGSDGLGTRWSHWTNSAFATQDSASVSGPATIRFTHPTPVLSSIEFNEREDMILAFADRCGDQFIADGYAYLSQLGAGSPTKADYRSSGDLLIAGKNPLTGNYTLENNGAFTSSDGMVYSSGAANNEGPGNSEFFKGDKMIGVSYISHEETCQGSVTMLKGTSNVVVNVMNPCGPIVFSGGNKKISTINGAEVLGSGYLTYQGASSGYGGKSNSLGDIELITPTQPIEIGNRLWYDDNLNGVQDADETDTMKVGTSSKLTNKIITLRSPGVDGVFGNADDQTWTTTTDAQGIFYFSMLSSSDNRRTASMVTTGTYINNILPGYSYRIETDIPTGYYVTSANPVYSGAWSSSMDIRDNDAVILGSKAVIMDFNTTVSNHSLDIGFSLAPVLPLPLLSFTGASYGCGTVLNWKTSLSTDIKQFEVEHSTDGFYFYKLKDVLPTGINGAEQLYTYTHPEANKGTNYYRIRVVSSNGGEELSKILVVNNNCENTARIYPNPAQDKVRLQGFAIGELVTVRLMDVSGKLVWQQQYASNPLLDINVANLPRGLYQLNAYSTSINQSIKLIKE